MSNPRTPAELRSLMAEGTGGEWMVDSGYTDSGYHFWGIAVRGVILDVCGEAPLDEKDARSIVALHNLGEKFAALWEAAEGVYSAMDADLEGPSIALKEAAKRHEALDRALADLRGGK